MLAVTSAPESKVQVWFLDEQPFVCKRLAERRASGPQRHEQIELVGGPLDGVRLDPLPIAHTTALSYAIPPGSSNVYRPWKVRKEGGRCVLVLRHEETCLTGQSEKHGETDTASVCR